MLRFGLMRKFCPSASMPANGLTSVMARRSLANNNSTTSGTGRWLSNGAPLRQSLAPSSALLQLKSGAVFRGTSFGAKRSISGEVVFTTSLVGYPESMTDPSYRGQVLVFTQPLIGNYGVPAFTKDCFGLYEHFESEKIQVSGIVVNDYSTKYSHWTAVESLASWCKRENVPAITGVDTRSLTQMLRDQGSSLGKLFCDPSQMSIPWYDPNVNHLVSQVSTKSVRVYNKGGQFKVALMDCGVKENIVRQLALLGCEVHRTPHNFDVSKDSSFDGIFISNGPGSPMHCTESIQIIRSLLKQDRPVFGICMGNLLMAAALDVPIYKLRFGNRAHNQPAINQVTGRCVITSQNPNDYSNEGIRHRFKPFSSVQFHPEAKGGPLDTDHLFYDFVQQVEVYKREHETSHMSVENETGTLLGHYGPIPSLLH